jgi:hypothetical protein
MVLKVEKFNRRAVFGCMLRRGSLCRAADSRAGHHDDSRHTHPSFRWVREKSFFKESFPAPTRAENICPHGEVRSRLPKR